MAVTGARAGSASGWQRLVARQMSQTLTVFVVPDTRIARGSGLDLAAAGLHVVATPRHASVLLAVGDLPDGLSRAVAIVYAQMPRPRAVFALGTSRPDPRLPADITSSLDQAGLVEGVERLRDHVARSSWSSDTVAFTAPGLAEASSPEPDDMHAHMDHGSVRHNHGGPGASDDQESDPQSQHGEERDADQALAIGNERDRPDQSSPMHDRVADAGSDNHRSDAASAHAGMSHMTHDCSSPAPASPDTHTLVDDGTIHDGPSSVHDQIGHDDQSMDPDPMDHSGHMMDQDGGGMDHSGHMMDDSGFMSMVAMTEGIPRSRDGLPMEWIETGFGPLFPGLPGGLAPVLTLDGDTVAMATVSTGVVHRGIVASLPEPGATLPNRLELLDPFAPIAYRFLANRAIATIDNESAATLNDPEWIGALERERAASHLGWLAAFGELLGASSLAARAGQLHLGLMQARDVDEVVELRPAIGRLLRDARRAPLLRRRLAGIGFIDRQTARAAAGPVARASGVSADARADDPSYQALGFRPVLDDGGDAFSRLWTRLQEITQSLDLIEAVGALTPPTLKNATNFSGEAMADVETPRGAASLHIEVLRGEIRAAHLRTSSAAHVALVPGMTAGAELGDALTAIASLDISPWELDQ